MPRVDELYQDVIARIQKSTDRRKRKFQHEELLPEDFSGQIFIKCRDEAARIRERINFLESERSKVSAEIKAAELEVRQACSHCWLPSKRKGDILTEFVITDPMPDLLRSQLTPKALAMRQKRVFPLKKHLQAIDRELSSRQMELSELRRIAERASRGDASLIFFLSDAWRGRLEIGAGLLGKLPPVARMSGTRIITDQFGNVLPQEAVVDGKPDMPAGQDPKMPGRAGSWRGDHEESLPGSPADRNATFTKPPQVGER